ncbi:actin monomer binding protein-like protein [Dendryphion nanum]|uniref:Actin monomer binding protein-like protein n=1 Tax=Dendryphion nanum TaxID=256645 RepID=A0A9P9D9F4_9PLEO|nr:actin monomer binding protein-like protein [Dendryphion nanum]
MTFEIPQTTHSAFKSFVTNPTLFTLPLQISHGHLSTLSPIPNPKDPSHTFQNALSQLDELLSPKTPLYLLIRHNRALTAVTFAPWLAEPELKNSYINNRQELVRALGEEHFSSSFISKEIGEITDARSWEERKSASETLLHEQKTTACADCDDCAHGDGEKKDAAVQDLGYQQNKCRLCDRRMKNKIEERAADALKQLHAAGSCVQLAVDMSTTTLTLLFSTPHLTPATLPSRLPTTTPSFTFYRHPTSRLLYFVFCSPDSCTVKQRMTHTMAIAGLVGVIAKECGAEVDQTIEIHEPEDLEFREGDERIGRFRSVFQLGEKVGTENVWEGMPVA